MAALVTFGVASHAASPPRLLDGFDDIAPWEAKASDGVAVDKRAVGGVEGSALRMGFDFKSVAGYAYVRRALPLDLPENYEISFWMRAEAPVNTFEVKFADASGDNVWWSQRRDFEFPREWRKIKIKKRHIGFAWGPAQDRELRRAEAIEFVVVAGRTGGHGWIEIDGLEIREAPPAPATFPAPLASASSHVEGGEPANAVDGRAASSWESNRIADGRQSLTLDLGLSREFGGLELEWSEGAFASRYDVLGSEDGAAWRLLRRVEGADGGRDSLRLHESEARFLRFDLHDGPGETYALADVQIKDLAFGAPNAFVESLARNGRRGLYPRGFSGEQPYWTVVGVDGGDESGLLSEDGALEVARGGFSIEPFVIDGGSLVTWADAEIGHSLKDGYLPIPSVAWRRPEWDMGVTAFAMGTPAQSQLAARYTVTNRTEKPLSLKLALAVRPLQVNPPSQSLNIAGGVSRIESLKWVGGTVWVNGQAKAALLSAPTFFAASAFDAGTYPEKLERLDDHGRPPSPRLRGEGT